MRWKQRTSLVAFTFALSSLSLNPSAHSADWACSVSQPVTGGLLHLLISGGEATPGAIQGAVELSTLNVAAPLGLRDGTYPWDVSQTTIVENGAVLSLNFDVTLPLSSNPNWGAVAGSLVPTQLNFLLPNLSNLTGAPIQLGGITLISGNGIYNSNNEWRVRSAEGAIIVSNAPEPLSLMYSRELLQIISNDPNEPISLFLTPAVPAPLDSIVSFHAGGIIEAPDHTEQLIQELIATNGACPTGPMVPSADP
jgi:hypothetical protein